MTRIPPPPSGKYIPSTPVSEPLPEQILGAEQLQSFLQSQGAQFGYVSFFGQIVIGSVKEPAVGIEPALVSMGTYDSAVNERIFGATGWLIGSYTAGGKKRQLLRRGIIIPNEKIVIERRSDNSKVGFGGPAGLVHDINAL